MVLGVKAEAGPGAHVTEIEMVRDIAHEWELIKTELCAFTIEGIILERSVCHWHISGSVWRIDVFVANVHIYRAYQQGQRVLSARFYGWPT
jgi:hypothetical protein